MERTCQCQIMPFFLLTDKDTKPIKREPQKKFTLKDLCAEDKQRIANLIRELAKLGDDKVLFEEQLAEERASFSEQVSSQ